MNWLFWILFWPLALALLPLYLPFTIFRELKGDSNNV